MTLQTVELNFRKYALFLFLPAEYVSASSIPLPVLHIKRNNAQRFANLIDRLIPHFLIALL